MTRRGILEHILFVAILVNLSTQALNAYVALSHVDALVIAEHRRSPRPTEERVVVAPANTRVVMTSNMAVIWRTPGTDKVYARTLSDEDSETLKRGEALQSGDSLHASVGQAASASDAVSIADAK